MRLNFFQEVFLLKATSSYDLLLEVLIMRIVVLETGKYCFVVQVGKIKGIPTRLHFTLLIAFLLITWTTAMVFMQIHYHGFTIVGYWIVAGIIAVQYYSYQC
jgi:hypothetical protein